MMIHTVGTQGGIVTCSYVYYNEMSYSTCNYISEPQDQITIIIHFLKVDQNTTMNSFYKIAFCKGQYEIKGIVYTEYNTTIWSDMYLCFAWYFLSYTDSFLQIEISASSKTKKL